MKRKRSTDSLLASLLSDDEDILHQPQPLLISNVSHDDDTMREPQPYPPDLLVLDMSKVTTDLRHIVDLAEDEVVLEPRLTVQTDDNEGHQLRMQSFTECRSQFLLPIKTADGDVQIVLTQISDVTQDSEGIA